MLSSDLGLDPELESVGLRICTANHHLADGDAGVSGTVDVVEVGDGQFVIIDLCSGKWFADSWSAAGGRSAHGMHTAMLGTVSGDMAGSVYEHNNIKHCLGPDELISPFARFTDDTVMTIAVAAGIEKALEEVPESWLGDKESEDVIFASVRDSMQGYGRRYPHAGYGGHFMQWILSEDPQPYGSYGNGAAMRASYPGWVARSLAEAERLGKLLAAVTHSHPEGIRAARTVAGGIFTLRHAEGSIADRKEAFASYIHAAGYQIGFTLDEIRESYRFSSSCQGSVPQAMEAFLEGEDFPDTLSKAISIGGDSDTIAAIAGSFAEAVYPIPEDLRGSVIDRLDGSLRSALIDAIDFAAARVRQDS